jgi:hypothetical protein
MASVAGVSDKKLSETYSVAEETIRKRRSRERWPTKSRLQVERKAAVQALNSKERETVPILHGAEQVTHPVTETPKAAEVVAQNLGECADAMAMALVPALSTLAVNAVTKSPQMFSPSDLKELTQAASLVWKLTGRDKPTAEVNLSLWTTQTPQPERDVTPSSVESVSDEWLE